MRHPPLAMIVVVEYCEACFRKTAVAGALVCCRPTTLQEEVFHAAISGASTPRNLWE